MIITDIHTHTAFSADGVDDIETMVSTAEQLNVKYYGIAEHFDYDYKVNGFSFGSNPPEYTDADKYFSAARKIQAEKKNLNLLVGCEFAFTENEAAIPLYNEVIKKYSPDFIVNSVHTCLRGDYYYPEAFLNKDLREVYEEYFYLVLKSVNAEYNYDIIAHLGYCSRYAPYRKKKIIYKDFAHSIDAILKEIINKDKILEVNSSASGAECDFLPDTDILKRYYALGGRNISYASDAHYADRITDKRDIVVKELKKIGFSHITVPFKGDRIKIKI